MVRAARPRTPAPLATTTLTSPLARGRAVVGVTTGTVVRPTRRVEVVVDSAFGMEVADTAPPVLTSGSKRWSSTMPRMTATPSSRAPRAPALVPVPGGPAGGRWLGRAPGRRR